MTLGGNYTWSHCIGDNTSLGANANINNAYVDPNNRDFDRGNCESDRRHNLNVTGVVETPTFANRGLRAAGEPDGGWPAFYRMASGSYMTILSGQDRALTAAGNQRAQQIVEDPFLERDG